MARLQVRRSRRPTTFRLKKREWVDPFPHIPGTEPEKRVFAALVYHGLYFIFQADLPIEAKRNSPLMAVRDFKPDFILPEWKVIIDPFGDFHHSQPEAIRRDAIKSVYYEALGYEFIHPWSSDVAKNGGDWVLTLSVRLRGPKLFELTREDAAFKRTTGYRLGPNLGLGSRSVAIANMKRTRPKAKTVRVRR